MRNTRTAAGLTAALSIALSPTIPAEPGEGTEFQRAIGGFGQINTIAGRGFVKDGNGWTTSCDWPQNRDAIITFVFPKIVFCFFLEVR